MKEAIITIKDISQELSNIVLEIIKAIEIKKIPYWFIEKLNSFATEQLWENEYLMRYNVFIDKVFHKKWIYKGFIYTDKTLELSFDLLESTGFLDILCVTSLIGIKLKNIEIDDPYFGKYIPE